MALKRAFDCDLQITSRVEKFGCTPHGSFQAHDRQFPNDVYLHLTRHNTNFFERLVSSLQRPKPEF